MASIGPWNLRRDRIVDVAIAVLVTLAALAPLERAGGGQSSPAALPFLGAAAIALLFRRRAPVAVLGVIAALPLVALALGQVVPALQIPIAIALYTVGRQSARRTLVICAAVLAAVLPVVRLLALAVPARSLADVLAPEVLQPAFAVAFAAALGAAVKANRDAVDAANDRARRAEESREAEADRRVAEDRLAIARDLHDSVAHRMAVINLHAGVAARAVRTRPDDAEQSITVIGDAARTVIAEIQDMLLVLRSGSDGRAGGDPGVERIDGLLSVFARSGLRVRVHRHGTLDGVDGFSGSVVYRVIQEGLTNAFKHGADRTAELTIRREAGSVVVRVLNPVHTDDARSVGGHGLIGMRERVRAAGGTMRTVARAQ